MSRLWGKARHGALGGMSAWHLAGQQAEEPLAGKVPRREQLLQSAGPQLTVDETLAGVLDQRVGPLLGRSPIGPGRTALVFTVQARQVADQHDLSHRGTASPQERYGLQRCGRPFSRIAQLVYGDGEARSARDCEQLQVSEGTTLPRDRLEQRRSAPLRVVPL